MPCRFHGDCRPRPEQVLAGTGRRRGRRDQPRYITFGNNRTVKFYRYSLQAVIEKEGRRFDGFHHV